MILKKLKEKVESKKNKIRNKTPKKMPIIYNYLAFIVLIILIVAYSVKPVSTYENDLNAVNVPYDLVSIDNVTYEKINGTWKVAESRPSITVKTIIFQTKGESKVISVLSEI